MDLEARVARFEQDVVVGDVELVEPLDHDVEVAAPMPRQNPIELSVPRQRRHVVQHQVLFDEGGERARQQQVCAVSPRSFPHDLRDLFQLLGHRAQTTATQDLGRQVRLDVELRKLRGETRVLGCLQHLLRDTGRTHPPVHQKTLLLGADSPRSRFKSA